jgi:hypothetical protein
MTKNKKPIVGQRYKERGADLLVEPWRQIKISKVANRIIYKEKGGWCRLMHFFSDYEEIPSHELKIDTN